MTSGSFRSVSRPRNRRKNQSARLRVLASQSEVALDRSETFLRNQDPSATSSGLKFRSVAVACAISFVPKRGKALSSETAHGHQAPRPSVFAQDDGRR